MGNDSDLYQSLGRIEGNLESLTSIVRGYITAHDARHAVIDRSVDSIKEDINQAKGAKSALLVVAAAVSAVVGTAIAAVEKIFK